MEAVFSFEVPTGVCVLKVGAELIAFLGVEGVRGSIVEVSAPFTNQQILMRCMRVIQSQASQSEEGFCPTPIFVGTHQDLEHQCPEPREEKNPKIHEMLPPAVQDNAIYCGEKMKELIFAVNAKTPGPQERKIAAELRRVIVERSRVKPKPDPSSMACS